LILAALTSILVSVQAQAVQIGFKCTASPAQIDGSVPRIYPTIHAPALSEKDRWAKFEELRTAISKIAKIEFEGTVSIDEVAARQKASSGTLKLSSTVYWDKEPLKASISDKKIEINESDGEYAFIWTADESELYTVPNVLPGFITAAIIMKTGISKPSNIGFIETPLYINTSFQANLNTSPTCTWTISKTTEN
jgi:hypothetical protein